MRPTTKKLVIIAAAFCLALPILILAAPTTYDAKNTGLEASGSAAGLNTASGQLPIIIGTVIKAGLGLIGMIFLGLMIYAGAYWMIARGDEAKVEKAKDTIINSIIGIIIVVGAYAITNLIVISLSSASSSGASVPVGACTLTTDCGSGKTCVIPYGTSVGTCQ